MSETAVPSEMPLIELYDFAPNPDASPDPAPEFIALDMGNDAPVALATDAPVATVETTETTGGLATMGDLASTLASLTSTNGSADVAGSIRSSGYVTPTGTQAFDQSALTSEELAVRAANQARSAAHHARVTRPTAAPVPPVDSEIVLLPAVNAAVETDEKQCGIELAWNPSGRDGHEIPRAMVCALLDENGLAPFHPPIPLEKGLFGVVFKGLNGAESRDDREDETRLIARCVTRNDYARMVPPRVWPENLVSRYVVGTIDASTDLGSLGSKDLVCSLVKVDGGYECQFSGGTTNMRNAITARFDALQGASVMNVTSLLKWYRETLEDRFGAIRDGFAMLIVDNGTELAKQRIATAADLASVLQGANTYGHSPTMGRRLKINRVVSRGGVTQSQFYANVGAALLDSVHEHGKVFATELAAAQDTARRIETAKSDATPASIEMAVRRAMIGSDRANSKAIGLLATLKALQARATAMVDAIGVHAQPAINACEALRAEWAPKCKGIDATSAMMAEIELD